MIKHYGAKRSLLCPLVVLFCAVLLLTLPQSASSAALVQQRLRSGGEKESPEVANQRVIRSLKRVLKNVEAQHAADQGDVHHMEGPFCAELKRDIQELQKVEEQKDYEKWAAEELRKEHEYLCEGFGSTSGFKKEYLQAHIENLKKVHDVLEYHREMEKRDAAAAKK